jgi:hypothetical protein
MRVEHHHPVVAIVAGPSGADTKTVHLTIGPGLGADGQPDPEAQQVTTLWAWSEHLGRPFAWIVTPNEPVLAEGSTTRWTLDLGPGASASLRVKSGAWCCGAPMKRWRPPGFERSKVGTT